MLLEKMKEYHFTQESLAKAVGAGMNQSKVSRILKGEQKPTLLQALRIEDLLGIPVRYWGTVAVANDNEPQSQSDEVPAGFTDNGTSVGARAVIDTNQ